MALFLHLTAPARDSAHPAPLTRHAAARAPSFSLRAFTRPFQRADSDAPLHALLTSAGLTSAARLGCLSLCHACLPMPALHQTSIPRLHAQPPRTIAHQIPSSQAGPLRLTPDSDGPDPGLAPDPTGLPRLRPSAWSSLPALASRPCHCGPWHTASRLITSLLSTGPLLPVRLGRLGRTTT